MAGRPRFKPTKPQRDRVKLLKADGWPNERIARQILDVKGKPICRNTLEAVFVVELEYGLDLKHAELLDAADKAAKKGNATMIKWLADRRDAARAAAQVAGREQPMPIAEPERPVKPAAKGKKELAQQSAEEVVGKFAPPAPPKLH